MTTETNATLSTQNDRIMAALAHTTAILPMMGVVAPIVIWVTQKDKSEYVGFQALQAIAYQLTMVLAWFVGMAFYFASFVATFISIPFGGSSNSFPVFFFVPFVVMALMMLGMLAFVVYGLIAAVMVLQGREFQYVVIGSLLKRYLQKK